MSADRLTKRAGLPKVLALARMLGQEDPSITLRTYADSFDSDLDALADVLDRHRIPALRPSNAIGSSETEGKTYRERWSKLPSPAR